MSTLNKKSQSCVEEFIAIVKESNVVIAKRRISTLNLSGVSFRLTVMDVTKEIFAQSNLPMWRKESRWHQGLKPVTSLSQTQPRWTWLSWIVSAHSLSSEQRLKLLRQPNYVAVNRKEFILQNARIGIKWILAFWRYNSVCIKVRSPRRSLP
jgi:hypothetical protein